MIPDRTQSSSQITNLPDHVQNGGKSRGTQRPQVKYLIASKNGSNNKERKLKLLSNFSFKLKLLFKSITPAITLIQAEHSLSPELLSQPPTQTHYYFSWSPTIHSSHSINHN